MLRAAARRARGALERALRPRRYPVLLRPRGRKPRGRVLLSYLEHTLALPDDDPGLGGHTNRWESREIARAFLELGFAVEGVNWADVQWTPRPGRQYAALFDIYVNLARLAPLLGPDTVLLHHGTGSDPNFQNAAEARRARELEQRRGAAYAPKRSVDRAEAYLESMRLAHSCSLLGNAFTLSTYPEALRPKVRLLPIPVALPPGTAKQAHRLVPQERHFLWFFGGGAVHKGLDLLLEVFARRPDLTLHVVGDAAGEEDFAAIYRQELFHTPNIRYHGFTDIASRAFRDVLDQCCCFVAPSCSEGMSPAVAACMQAGLYPVISRETGVDFPDGCGTFLETCSQNEIERAMDAVRAMAPDALGRRIAAAQAHALSAYTREAYARALRDHLSHCLC